MLCRIWLVPAGIRLDLGDFREMSVVPEDGEIEKQVFENRGIPENRIKRGSLNNLPFRGSPGKKKGIIYQSHIFS